MFGNGEWQTAGSDWSDHISRFTLGLIKKEGCNKEDVIVYPMCKIGSGFTRDELNEIQMRLKPYWRR